MHEEQMGYIWNLPQQSVADATEHQFPRALFLTPRWRGQRSADASGS